MRLAVLSAIAALAVTGSASANPGKNLDSDGDGVISQAEYDASVQASWTALDQDGNGQLSPAELGDKAARLADVDSDGDGQISVAEYTAKKSAWFAAADTDGDGALSKAEWEAAKAAKKK